MFSSIQFKPFSLAEMAEVEIVVADEIKCLKKEITSLRKNLGRADVAKEELLTFGMLDKYPHIVQQQAWPWRWENVDALYTLTDRIPAWVVDDAIMAIWASGRQGLPNSYTNWDSKNKEAGVALMLSRVPSCLGMGTDLEGKKVYSAIIMFVHPKQELLTIKEGADCLTVIAKGPDSDATVPREPPSHKHGRFYPSAINHAHPVLLHCGKKGKPKKLRLDLAMCYNHHPLVCHPHRWEGKHGDPALPPPAFSADPTLPILLPVRYIGELWLNDIYNTPVAAGGTGMGAACPATSRLSCCHLEVIAGKTLADWTEDAHVVYPGPPTAPTPKDDKADESDNDPKSPSKGLSDEPVDDDKKSEHGGGSGKDATPKSKEDQESEDESDDQSKAPKDQTAVSRDSGLGASSSGYSIGADAKVAPQPAILASTSVRAFPCPLSFRRWISWERLADDLYAYSGELFQGLEETSMAMLDRVLSGFKRSGGRAREYIHETAAITINFFSRAGDMEAELESSKALKFQEAVNGMKESICDLIRRTALAEESYEDAAAQFDNILASVSDELKEFVESQGEEQRQVYIAKCLEWIRGVHGSLDGTQFIPMIISNVTTHHALALNQRVNQSQIPLQIMISPMRTQAATMGIGLKFVEFLSKRVLALDVKLGPASSVSLESGGEEAGVQSTSGMGGRATPMVASPPTPPEKDDSSKTPFTARMPPTTDHTPGASRAKTPDTPAKPKTMFSPRATASLTKFMGMSDDEGMPQKRRGGSAGREVASKKAKVDDDSDSYSSPTPSKSDVPKKEVKKRKTKKKMPSSDNESSYASAEERATPKKSSRDEKAEQIAWANQDRTSKWKKDLVYVDKYRQRKGLCTKELVSGPNNTRQVNLLTQLLHEGQLGLNIVHIDECVNEVTEDSSKQARKLLKALEEVRGKTMGCSGIYPEYVVKPFLAPQSQCVIQKGDNNHWDTSVMIGL